MKQIATFLSESEYREFSRKATELNMTDYALVKTAVKVFINDPKAKEKTMFQKLVEFWEKLP